VGHGHDPSSVIPNHSQPAWVITCHPHGPEITTITIIIIIITIINITTSIIIRWGCPCACMGTIQPQGDPGIEPESAWIQLQKQAQSAIWGMLMTRYQPS
jgi:hypothetical protein